MTILLLNLEVLQDIKANCVDAYRDIRSSAAVALALVLIISMIGGCFKEQTFGTSVLDKVLNDKNREIIARFDQVIMKLASDDYKEREKASKEIGRLLRTCSENWKFVIQYLKEVRENSEDPEVCFRLGRVLDPFFKPWKYFKESKLLHSVGFSSVRPMAFSSDGILAQPGGFGILIWDSQTRQCLRTLDQDNVFSSVAFSPDGNSLAAAEMNGAIQIWGPHTGKRLRTYKRRVGSINSLAFDPTGKLLAYIENNNVVRVLDSQTGDCLYTIKGDMGKVSKISFSPTGKLFVVTSVEAENPMIHVWDLQAGKQLRGLNALANSVAFNPDGTLMASSNSAVVYLWDISSGKRLLTLRHTRPSLDWEVSSVDFSPDGKVLVSTHVHVSGTLEEISHWASHTDICFWNVADGKCLRILEDDSGEISSIRFSPDGMVLAGSVPGGIIIWRILDMESKEESEKK